MKPKNLFAKERIPFLSGLLAFSLFAYCLSAKGRIRLFFICFWVGGLSTVYSFSQGTWATKSPLPAQGRWGAVAFNIGLKGYIGTGSSYSNDFWEYDPAANSWAQKANFTGVTTGGSRCYAVGFSIGNKGYLGTGADMVSVMFNDFWEYDPVTNTWTQKANFGGTARRKAVGFSIGGKGYIGTGDVGITTYQDFWEYDPVTDTWIQKVNFGGGDRSEIDRSVFVIGNKAYIGLGWSSTNPSPTDFWEYDPVTNTWTQKANFPGGARQGATGFSICNMGFLGLGLVNTADFWQYNPFTNSWSAVANFPGGARGDQPAFVINNKAYVGTGAGGGGIFSYNDLWEFTFSIAPTAAIASSSNTICSGMPVTLSASGGNTYSWSNGSINNLIVVSPTASTTYSVIVSDVCGSDTAAVTISVTAVTANIPTVVNTNCYGQCTGSATASANGGTPAYAYSWSTLPIQNKATATGLCVGIYTCTITDANGCADNVSVTIKEIPCPCPADINLTIPNAFSPNRDGENDEFCLPAAQAGLQGGIEDCIQELKVFIYDRWGEKVYESTDPKFCWDGTYGSTSLTTDAGKVMNSAVFVYYLKATLISGETITKKGNISLLR